MPLVPHPHPYDVIVVGGGPAGAVCAATVAATGGRVLVIERAIFPRDKVCGDCLNPVCWPVLARLGLEDAVRALPHATLELVEFLGLSGRDPIRLNLPRHDRGEIAVKRSLLDALLLENAARRGVEVRHGRAVSGVRRLDPAGGGGFSVTLSNSATSATPTTSTTPTTPASPANYSEVSARFLVAADGRNSVIARLLGLLGHDTPATRRANTDRIGLQTHVPCPPDFGAWVQMRWFPHGYGGLCPVGGGELNVSLAGPPATLVDLKRWAQNEFHLSPRHPWRTIAPLDRPPAPRAAVASDHDPQGHQEGAVFLVGDAARVVEPFTGEGIFYALRSGELAAEGILAALHHGLPSAQAAVRYCHAHKDMYRGRLWVNRLARAAGRHPRLASLALTAARWRPEWLGLLTAKVVR